MLYLIVNLGIFSDNLAYSLETSPIYPPIDWVSVGSYIWVILAFGSAIGLFMLARLTFIKLRLSRIQSNLSDSILEEVK